MPEMLNIVITLYLHKLLLLILQLCNRHRLVPLLSLVSIRWSNNPTAIEYLEERRYLYLQCVYCPDQSSATYPTLFAMTKQILFSFFGREPFYGILLSQATAENTVECDY